MSSLLLINDPAAVALLRRGDPSCAIAIGSTVRKKLFDIGDVLPIGWIGTVKGNKFFAEAGTSLYLIQWNDVPGEAITREAKIEEI